MKFIGNVKKQSLIISLIAIGLAVLISGVSYAFFFQVKSNSNYQQVKTGDLTITSSVSGVEDSEVELLPISDNDATTGESGYITSVIDVSNTGSLSSSYDLVIDYDLTGLPSGKSEEDLLDQNYIGYAVFSVAGDVKTLVASGTLGESALLEESSTARTVLVGQKLSDSSSIVYEVRIWVKDTVTNDLVGKLVYLKTNVVSVVDVDSELSD